VVSKNELLDALWPDTQVTESSLQRAVSLARAALRQGGQEGALKNVPRMGYRFVAELAGDTSPEAVAVDGLEQQADREKWAGNLSRAVELLEQALEQYRAAGDNAAAARVAIRLARIQQERRKADIAAGWLALAGNLLRELPTCREHSLLHWMHGELALVSGDPDKCLQCTTAAYDIARTLRDVELESLALATRGHALMSTGEVASAKGCHEEAAALTLAGGVGPEHGGYVLCSVITSAVNRGDWACAGQWSEQFTRWCERFGVAAYPGLCQLHRAEVHHFKGELPRALAEIEQAVRILKEAAPWAEGDAWRVLGDVQYAQGDLKAAEQSYHRAYSLGWDPHPGLAWLLLARGDAEAAVSSLLRAIQSESCYSRERRPLMQAHLVTLACAAGKAELARATLKQLEARGEPELPMQKALLARASSRVLAMDRRFPQALAQTQKARRHWLELGASLEAAMEHLEAARILHALEDPTAAEMELAAAAETFRAAGAMQLHQHCEAERLRLKRKRR
jgi:tetratricopeptide (TPR) repeat protein